MNMFQDPLVILCFASIIVIAFIILIAVTYLDPMRKKIKELGGKITRRGAGVLAVDGSALTLEYFSGSRDSSPWLKIAASGTFGSDLVIRQETSSDKFFKKIGLNREVQLSDQEIDEKLFFECDNPEFLKQLFLNADLKPLVLNILGHFSSIEITRNRCTFKRCPCEALNKISNEWVFAWARQLLAFVASVPRFVPGHHPEIASFKTWRVVLYAIGFVAFIAGIVSFLWANISFRVVDGARLWLLSIEANIVLSAGAFYYAFQKIKGFSRSARVLTHFLCTFGVGILLLGRYGVAVANGYFDETSARKFEQPLIGKYTTTHKSTTTYHAVVAPWHPEGRGWEFTVSPDAYGKIRVGRTYYGIVTKSGRYGFEWVVSERLIR